MRSEWTRIIAAVVLAVFVMGVAGCSPDVKEQPDLGTMPMLAPANPDEVSN